MTPPVIRSVIAPPFDYQVRRIDFDKILELLSEELRDYFIVRITKDDRDVEIHLKKYINAKDNP